MSKKNQCVPQGQPEVELQAGVPSGVSSPPIREKVEEKGKVATNRSYPCQTAFVSKSEIEDCVKAEILRQCQALYADFTKLLQQLKDRVDKRFVVMKSKDVWFDRDVAALFPRMDKHDMPAYRCDGQQEVRKFTGYNQNGYTFVMMSPQECNTTFVVGNGNPCLDDNGYIKNIGTADYNQFVITEEFVRANRSDCIRAHYTYNKGSRGNKCVWFNDEHTPPISGCSYKINLIPIYRLKGKNASPMTFAESVLSWLKEDLVPEELTDDEHKLYKKFMTSYDVLSPYIKLNQQSLSFDEGAFMQDALSGRLTATISGGSFDFVKNVEAVMNKEQPCPVPNIKEKLLNCDWKRANLAPYVEKQLTDMNLGHWELFEDMVNPPAGLQEVQLPEREALAARPPQRDVHLNGTCGIDFGTKSTVVVCRLQEERLLRVGKGDYSKAPSMADYENPTVIELRDLAGFRQAYAARTGRPFTEWEQMTVSHQAAEAIFQSEDDSSVYYSVFSELKQWAIDKKRRLMLRDRKGHTLELKPYLELGEDDFDPIEAYAYYLGLYINNMHNGIFIDYILSFPVNYSKEVQDRIRLSFERGLRKSLPPALLQDENLMEQFYVYAGASEPAAYAISALQQFGLEPKEVGEVVYYGVFDFGGGTTDFDFGMEQIPANHRWKFEIDQFGSGGDVYLGGENLLDLLAYEVYKDNIDTMRQHKIPFVLPPKGRRFAGSEMLVFERHDASQQAFMNSERLAKLMRPIWERHENYAEKYEQGNVAIHLFSTQNGEGGGLAEVSLKVDVARLEQCIEDRIRDGVDNFFTALQAAFADKEPPCIHIFLAGNSCKSPVVKKLFDEAIEGLGQEFTEFMLEKNGQTKEVHRTFMLHLPLGMADTDAAEPTGTETKAPGLLEYDKVLTGKTGVAFGLLRSRVGGRDVKINNHNITSAGGSAEVTFPWYLGNIDQNGHFHVVIGHNHGYGTWVPFTYGDERFFELYYTREPKSQAGQMAACDVSMVRCRLTPAEISEDEDARVYIRKVGPDCIEYAVGTEKDFSGPEVTKKIHSQLLE